MKNFAASGKTIIWRMKDRDAILLNTEGASVGEQPESLVGFLELLCVVSQNLLILFMMLL